MSLGQLHHVRGGRREFDAKLLALPPQTVVVIDWFAPWCGPCRQIAPHFELLASKYPTCLFLSIDTENEQNSNLAPSPPLKAFPTFEVFTYPASTNSFHERFEGANLQRVEALVNQALDETHKLKICFVERGKPDFHMRAKPESTLSDLAKQRAWRGEEVWILNKKVLSFTNQGKWTLEEVGFTQQQVPNTVRVLPLPRKLMVRLKLVGSENAPDRVCQFGPFATCGELLREVRLFTQTAKPKAVYLGKMIEDPTKLVSNMVQDQATVLCMPSGGPYNQAHDDEQADVVKPAAPVVNKAVPSPLFIDEENDDLYALDVAAASEPTLPLPAIVAAVTEPPPSLPPTHAAAPPATQQQQQEKAAEPRATFAKIQFLPHSQLSPLLFKAESLYLSAKKQELDVKAKEEEDDQQLLRKSFKL